jgi:hypothetical protein
VIQPFRTVSRTWSQGTLKFQMIASTAARAMSVSSRRCIPGITTSRSLATALTPATRWAARWAASFSAKLSILPVRVTTPSWTTTPTSLALMLGSHRNSSSTSR